MRRIIIADTQGGSIGDGYRARLPGITLRGIETDATRGTACHPHGLFCGWLAAIPLLAVGGGEIVFVRIMDSDGKPIEGFDRLLLDAIAEESPSAVSRSWGAWDGDQDIFALAASLGFEDFVAAYRSLWEETGFVDFAAAGNQDRNDADSDIAYPQALMPDISNIIGARYRDGRPAEWSGDGPGLQCLFWGVGVYSPDADGNWVAWSGTSAATPKAAGACVALGYSHEQWRREVERDIPHLRPVGDWELPHPKWGWGDREMLWQNFARRVPEGLMPPARERTAAITPTYMDYRRWPDEAAPGDDQIDRPAPPRTQDEPALEHTLHPRAGESGDAGANRRPGADEAAPHRAPGEPS